MLWLGWTVAAGSPPGRGCPLDFFAPAIWFARLIDAIMFPRNHDVCVGHSRARGGNESRSQPNKPPFQDLFIDVAFCIGCLRDVAKSYYLTGNLCAYGGRRLSIQNDMAITGALCACGADRAGGQGDIMSMMLSARVRAYALSRPRHGRVRLARPLHLSWFSAPSFAPRNRHWHSSPSRAPSSSAPALWEPPTKATRSRCPPTATPRSWAGLATTGERSGVGLHPQRRGVEPAGREAGRQRRCRRRPARPFGRAVRRRQHRDRRRLRRQRGQRSGMGLHPQRRGMEPAGPEARRHRRCGNRRPRRFGRALRRRQHRDRGRVRRQRGHRSGVGLHPQRRGVEPAGREARRQRRCRSRLSKATRSRSPPTATPRSWAGTSTTRSPERRGSSPAAAGCGASKD